MVPWHYLMTSTLFKSYLACFFHFLEISNLFVFLITLSVLMLKKCNFAVILSLKHKWVVKRLKFGSYFMINCGETGNDIFVWWFLNSYRLTSYLKPTGVSYWCPQLLSVISLASAMYQKRGKSHQYCKTMHT